MKNTTGISGGGSRLRQRPAPSSSHSTDTQPLGCDILNAGKINYLLSDDLCVFRLCAAHWGNLWGSAVIF